ncbi:MAG TPA: histidine--tRNA ligase, partial [Solibacterales bacterium]|nr:histidine--tRNA ligase [Bryobacterales bacterium]
GARCALFLGESELASGAYPLKVMATGEQRTVTLEELPAALRSAGK